MPIEIELPDGTVVEFPDEMSDAEIEAVLRDQMPEKQAKPRDPEPPVDYTAQAARETYDPSPWYQKPFIAAGAEMTRLGRGIGQLVTPSDSSWGRSLQASVDADAPYQEGIHGPSSWLGRALPYLATLPLGGPEAAALGRIGQAGRLAQTAVKAGTAAAEGAAYGSLGEVRTGESRLANALYGAVGGTAGRGLVGAARGGASLLARSPVDDVMRNDLVTALREGIPLHVSQVAESTPARLGASLAKYLPFSGAGAAARNQQDAWNRALTRYAGREADRLDDAWLGDQKQHFKSAYDALWGRNDVSISPSRLTEMAQVVNDAPNNLMGENAALVGKQLDRVMKEIEAAGGTGTIPGRTYQDLRAALAGVEPGTNVGNQVTQIRRALEGAADDSLSGADSALLSETNQQYRNFKVLEKLLARAPGAAADISPAQLWGAVNQRGPRATQEYRDLARVGQNLLKDPIPQNGLVGGTLAGIFSGAAGAMGGPATAVGALAAGPVLGRALNSASLGNALARRQLAPNALYDLLTAGGSAGAIREGAGRAVQGTATVNAANDPLAIGISGGRVGAVVTPEELELLRAQMRARAAGGDF